MDKGAWQATVHGVAVSDMTERLTLLVYSFRPQFPTPPPGGHHSTSCLYDFDCSKCFMRVNHTVCLFVTSPQGSFML